MIRVLNYLHNNLSEFKLRLFSQNHRVSTDVFFPIVWFKCGFCASASRSCCGCVVYMLREVSRVFSVTLSRQIGFLLPCFRLYSGFWQPITAIWASLKSFSFRLNFPHPLRARPVCFAVWLSKWCLLPAHCRLFSEAVLSWESLLCLMPWMTASTYSLVNFFKFYSCNVVRFQMFFLCFIWCSFQLLLLHGHSTWSPQKTLMPRLRSLRFSP